MTIEVRELHMKERSLSGGRAGELGVNTEWKYLLNRFAISLSEHTEVLSRYTERGLSYE